MVEKVHVSVELGQSIGKMVLKQKHIFSLFGFPGRLLRMTAEIMTDLDDNLPSRVGVFSYFTFRLQSSFIGDTFLVTIASGAVDIVCDGNLEGRTQLGGFSIDGQHQFSTDDFTKKLLQQKVKHDSSLLSCVLALAQHRWPHLLLLLLTIITIKGANKWIAEFSPLVANLSYNQSPVLLLKG